MEERLLLDRITLHPRDIAERDAQLAILVEADPANAVSSRTDETAVPASNATNPLPLGRPQRSNGRVAAQDIGQRPASCTGLCRDSGRSGIGSCRRFWSCISHKALKRLNAMLRHAGALSKAEGAASITAPSVSGTPPEPRRSLPELRITYLSPIRGSIGRIGEDPASIRACRREWAAKAPHPNCENPMPEGYPKRYGRKTPLDWLNQAAF